jgi:hypothetical protein
VLVVFSGALAEVRLEAEVSGGVLETHLGRRVVQAGHGQWVCTEGGERGGLYVCCTGLSRLGGWEKDKEGMMVGQTWRVGYLFQP